MPTWRDDPLQVVTVTLYDRGFQRYYVVGVNKSGVESGVVMWSQTQAEIYHHCERLGIRNVRVVSLKRGRFWAELRQGKSFRGDQSGETLYKVEASGDWILWPEYRDTQKERAS